MGQQEDPLVAALATTCQERLKLVREYEVARESPAYQASLAALRRTVEGLCTTLHICEIAATRWPVYSESYLFPRHKDDIGEAAIIAQFAIENGALNSARRELRYMLEVAVNTAFVDEEVSGSSLDERITFYKSKRVIKRNVEHIDQLKLLMLGDKHKDFIQATRNAWINASNYVHLTKQRIDEKVRLRAEGITLGFETPEMLATVVREVHDVCSIIVVLAFESIGPPLTGDIILAGGLDSDDRWPFHESYFIAAVDAHFDYKDERQADLVNHIARRQSRIHGQIETDA